jgi:hypothetical protein
LPAFQSSFAAFEAFDLINLSIEILILLPNFWCTILISSRNPSFMVRMNLPIAPAPVKKV